ncbi:SDR family oxidoreductase [Leptospira sp. GIMC2001]|uniref:SDR family oxidoreductase n=1 Tax=Leptospira sp. GIMC2001 TaxID=1513297 RepID=UPI00234B07BE|nr:aldehyde reductase [Leptospira sp. GIMC2001]WCL50133.1 aldehyde reductase [Leptospira sp. GIMC2001]
MPNSDKNIPIFVSGASGYIASWIIKYLLIDGYKVHGTVRSLNDTKKIEHLLKFQTTYPGQLNLFEADLLSPGSFDTAIDGCEIVIHTASPFFVTGISDPQKELIDPAVKGTENILNSCNKFSSVKRVVLTSSVAAVMGDNIDAQKSKDSILDESYWNQTSNLSHQPYSYSKKIAEEIAWKIASEQSRWDLVTINPSFVLGPSLSSRMDGTSVQFVRRLISGELKMGVPNLYFAVVDVRDVAQAHLLAALENKSKGRYILSNTTKSMLELCQIIEKIYPNKYPTGSFALPNFLMYVAGPILGLNWEFLNKNLGISFGFNHSRSLELGIKYTDLELTLKDHVEQLNKLK